ncbi:MAG: flagellar hook-basal body complex protein [Caloramator sp.]|nr:flagellar hook-basal body complex protein [Caloramator sp.]
MLRVLWNGKSGLISNQNRIDALSNNIANVDTNGYKRVDVAFLDVLNESIDRLGVPITSDNRENLSVGSGTKGDLLVRDFSQGILKETGKKTDLAIEGEGYFRLKDNKGQYFYSRDGAFKIDSDGNFVHPSGLILDVENYNNNLSENDKFRISYDGNIYKINDDEEELVGKINLYKVIGQDSFVSKGENVYSAENVEVLEAFRLRQGFLESSNADITKELTNMLVTQRAFELNARTVKSADEMWQIANNLRGR